MAMADFDSVEFRKDPLMQEVKLKYGHINYVLIKATGRVHKADPHHLARIEHAGSDMSPLSDEEALLRIGKELKRIEAVRGGRSEDQIRKARQQKQFQEDAIKAYESSIKDDEKPEEESEETEAPVVEPVLDAISVNTEEDRFAGMSKIDLVTYIQDKGLEIDCRLSADKLKAAISLAEAST